MPTPKKAEKHRLLAEDDPVPLNLGFAASSRHDDKRARMHSPDRPAGLTRHGLLRLKSRVAEGMQTMDRLSKTFEQISEEIEDILGRGAVIEDDEGVLGDDEG